MSIILKVRKEAALFALDTIEAWVSQIDDKWDRAKAVYSVGALREIMEKGRDE